MKVLIDTSVLAELAQRQPNPKVLAFLEKAVEEDLYVSVISIGEIRKSLVKLKDAKRQETLSKWLEQQLLPTFEKRILNLDTPVLLAWGELCGGLEAKGRALPLTDGLIAALAKVHDLTVATRFPRDFEPTGVKVINPWE
jgi:predicted nucleic acid-binding protein